MSSLRTIAIATVCALLGGVAVAVATQTNYLGTVFIADTTTPTNQLAVNSDGSINAKVSGTVSPSGAAGGDLGGTYPNPTVANGSHITNASIPNSGLATPAPCSAFGTTSGTCAQGNDSRFPSVVTSAGSWTLADNSAANLTFTGVSTTYNQIGNMVWIGFQFTYPSTASSAVASIKGIPVPVANANYAKGGCVVVVSATIVGGVVMIPVINTSTINFDVANLSAAVLNSALSTDTIIGSCWYPAS